MSKMNELDVKRQETGLAVAGDVDMTELMEELDGVDLSFDKIKIPSGGLTVFEVPGDDPENPDTTKELIGVIVHHQATNLFYYKSFEEMGPDDDKTPDCSSRDGKTGIRKNGAVASCKSCKYNQWGSGKNGGKACQNRMNLYILLDGAYFPVVLSLPGTAIKAFNGYIQSVVLRSKKRLCAVKTKITLKKAQSKGGITYATPVFTKIGELEGEELSQAFELRETCKAYAASQEAVEDTEETGNGEFVEIDEDEDMPF